MTDYRETAALFLTTTQGKDAHEALAQLLSSTEAHGRGTAKRLVHDLANGMTAVLVLAERVRLAIDAVQHDESPMAAKLRAAELQDVLNNLAERVRRAASELAG